MRFKTLIFNVFLMLSAFFIQAQSIKTIKLPELQQKYLKDNDTLYIVNFWATWCRPCVEEMPGFLNIHQKFADQKLKMILVSLDFKSDLNKLEKFVAKNKIKAEVVLLNETKYNEWIDKIDPSWGGAIPATLILKNNSSFKLFHEKSITESELENIVNQQLKN